MIKADISDTIASIATPVGESGIGIVRISGRNALAVADNLFVAKGGKKPSEFKSFTTHYGFIIDPQRAHGDGRLASNTQYVDEVILTLMRSPRSYTKEDIVEINCHGGIVALRKVLALVLENGCRLAEPGEFTKRAFLNGRIDLTQAEAVLDIIRAKTEYAMEIGLEQLRGNLSRQINKIRESLLEALSILEANIDFPEEEIGAINLKQVCRKVYEASRRIQDILKTSRQGLIAREGIHVVICGKPNVGKSSLLNALLNKERSIVTPVAGTTRDTIEEIIDIRGIPVRIVDTAGIIEPKDLVAKEAVLRSKKQIRLADLAILLFDGNKKLDKEDRMLMKRLDSKLVIAAVNKMDLSQNIEKEEVSKKFDFTIDISAKKQKNIDRLESLIADLVYNGRVVTFESAIVSNLRHISALRCSQKFIAEAVDSLDNTLSPELVAQGIKDAIIFLDDILGKRYTEDLLGNIFANFCIGK